MSNFSPLRVPNVRSPTARFSLTDLLSYLYLQRRLYECFDNTTLLTDLEKVGPLSSFRLCSRVVLCRIFPHFEVTSYL